MDEVSALATRAADRQPTNVSTGGWRLGAGEGRECQLLQSYNPHPASRSSILPRNPIQL